MGCAESRDWLPLSVEVFAVQRGGIGARSPSRPVSKDPTHDGSKDSPPHPIQTLTVAMVMPERAATVYGAPDKVWVQLTFGAATPSISIDVQWQGKSATRLPEGILLAFPMASCPRSPRSPLSPLSPHPGHLDGGAVGARKGALKKKGVSQWELNKLGSWVNSRDVVPNGGAAHLHAVGDGGVRRVCPASQSSTTVNVVALDSALFSVGRDTSFPTPLEPLSASEANAGVFAVLHNNHWNTNYPLW